MDHKGKLLTGIKSGKFTKQKHGSFLVDIIKFVADSALLVRTMKKKNKIHSQLTKYFFNIQC
jgi:hypothetical protein